MEFVQIYFKKPYKVAVISNFLAFVQFLVDKFTLLDPDPGGKMNADPCRSGSTALHCTVYIQRVLHGKHGEHHTGNIKNTPIMKNLHEKNRID